MHEGRYQCKHECRHKHKHPHRERPAGRLSEASVARLLALRVVCGVVRKPSDLVLGSQVRASESRITRAL